MYVKQYKILKYKEATQNAAETHTTVLTSRWEGHSVNIMLTKISVFLAKKILKTFATTSQK
jgi:hypothetical protein